MNVILKVGTEQIRYQCSQYCPYDEIMHIFSSLTKVQGHYLCLLDEEGIPCRKITHNEQLLGCDKKTTPGFILIPNKIDVFEYHHSEGIEMNEQDKELQGLFRQFTIIRNQLSDFHLNKQVTNFMIGLTGSGKSTFVNHSLEIPLKMKKHHRHGLYWIQQEEGVSGPQIGNENISCTILPGFYSSEKGTIYCDLSGFLDTKGAKQQILNSYSNSLLFKPGTFLRMIIVIEESTVLTHRGGDISNIINRIEKLFPEEFSSLADSSLIIISKSDPQNSEDDYCQALLEIAKQTENMSKQGKQYLTSIILGGGLYLFPKPRMHNGQELEIKTTFKAHYVLQRIHPYELQKSGMVSLSQKAQNKMVYMMQNLQAEISEELGNLNDRFDLSRADLNDPEGLGVLCKNLNEAHRLLSISSQFPYDVDSIISACTLLHINLPSKKYKQTLGHYFINIRRCAQMHPKYQFKNDLLDFLLQSIKRKESLFQRYLENYYHSLDIKNIQKLYQQQQEAVRISQNEDAEELRRSLNHRFRQTQRRNSAEMRALREQLESQRRKNQRVMEEVRREIRGYR